MMSVIQSMLGRYPMNNPDERVHAMKQVVQEITLSALSRTGFFRNAAFYGGTALRVFHGLDRFSEDLDFSLLQRDPDFQLDAHRVGRATVRHAVTVFRETACIAVP